MTTLQRNTKALLEEMIPDLTATAIELVAADHRRGNRLAQYVVRMKGIAEELRSAASSEARRASARPPNSPPRALADALEFEARRRLSEALGIDDLVDWDELLDLVREHAARPKPPGPFEVSVLNKGRAIMLVDGKNDSGFPVGALLNAVDRAMSGNVYRLCDGKSSADAVRDMAVELSEAKSRITRMASAQVEGAPSRKRQCDDALALLDEEADVLLDGPLGQRGIDAGRVWKASVKAIRDTQPIFTAASEERPGSLTSVDLSAIAAALAPGEALDLAGIIARAAAYRAHSIELAAIRAVVDPLAEGCPGVDPLAWDACEDAVGAPHRRVCVLTEALNACADALEKARVAGG